MRDEASGTAIVGSRPLTADSLLEALVEAKALGRTGQDAYVRARPWRPMKSRPRPQ
jgi:hypothetical protein